MRYRRVDAARAFGQAVKEARLIRGLTQERLAELGDFDRTYPSLLERGRRAPTFFIILQLAAALRMSPAVLFNDAVARLRAVARQ
jgi:transcriptional regulator with XRE-family HTH domain